MQIITNPEFDNRLKQLAQDFGFMYRGNASPTNLINEIAEGKLKIVREQEKPPHQNKIEELISNKQPFKIYYLDAAGDPFNFTAEYAEIAQHEGKPYLDIRFVEERDDAECHELRHNRCLRIDRIPSHVTLEPVNIPWKENGLDFIEVEFELFGNLAFAYSREESDITEWLGEKHIKITRRVTNLFWLKRKLRQYLPQIKINSPDYFKDKFFQEIKDFLGEK